MIPIDCHLDGLLHRPWLGCKDDSENVASPTSAASLQKQQAESLRTF